MKSATPTSNSAGQGGGGRASRRLRRLGFLFFFLCAAAAPAGHAQLFADDTARKQAGENSAEIENIKILLRDMNDSLLQLRQMRQQVPLLTQKNQSLEAQVRALHGQVEELQQQLAAATRQNSTREQAAAAQQTQQIAALEQQLAEARAQLERVDRHLADISQFVTLPPEDELYAAAAAEYQKGNLVKAIAAFHRVLAFYPDGQFSANCHYWLGQAYLSQQNYADAGKHAQALLASAQPSDKAPAAMLILAQALDGLGSADEAQAQLRALIQQHPTSLAADSARQLLAQ